MQIIKVYDKYPVPGLLREHHLRVASVGIYICDNFKHPGKIDKKLIIKTLLLHDLGNIIKFDLTKADFFSPDEYKNIAYWKKQQVIYKSKFRDDEYLATDNFVREMGQEDVRNVLNRSGFTKLKEVLVSSDYNLKIATYADLRCSPFSVVALNERFDDLAKRYKGRNHQLSDRVELRLRRKRALELERQLQKESLISLVNITESDIKSFMVQMASYEI